MTDLSTTCPYCSHKTEIICDFFYTNLKAQVHECLNKNCQAIFVEQETLVFL